MEYKVTRWEHDTPPSEQELREVFRTEKLTPYTWSNGPGDSYAAHVHGYHKVSMIVRGSISWELPDLGVRVETGPGDRLDLPAGTQHAAQVGAEGVICLEGHKR